MTPQRKRANQRATADALFSKLVRAVGYCELAGEFGVECNGNLQCSHIFSRSYRIVQFERINAICACAAHHFWTTNHDLQWQDWAREALGEEVYMELRRKAVAGGRNDYRTSIPDLRRRLEAAA